MTRAAREEVPPWKAHCLSSFFSKGPESGTNLEKGQLKSLRSKIIFKSFFFFKNGEELKIVSRKIGITMNYPR